MKPDIRKTLKAMDQELAKKHGSKTGKLKKKHLKRLKQAREGK